VRLEPAVRFLARLYPSDVTVSDDLVDSLAFIESDLEGETVVRAGYATGIVALLPLCGLFLAPLPLSATLAVILATALGLIHTVHTAPQIAAAIRRTEALGETPTLIGRAVLRMQIEPTTERAVRFAADTGEGPLAKSLDGHIERANGTPQSGLIAFATEWVAWFPALRRSAYLLETAQDAPDGDRGRTLERALGAILTGTRDQMATFTSAIRGPATGLYAFGVLLPLALVALVPAGAIVGYAVSVWPFVFLYNLVLPGTLIAASIWMLSRRPVAFPPPTVTRDHPDVPERLPLRLTWGVAAAVVAFVFTALLGPRYLAPIAALGMGLGVTLMALFHPIVAVRNHVRAVEAHLVDALYLIGRQVTEGRAVESAVALAADRVPAETGAVFATAAGVDRRLHVGVEAAFIGEYGALRDVPSPRAHSMARLLAIAATEGQPAGHAIVSMADHLEELQAVERETRRQLSMVTDTLEHTASFFAPLIGGSTVALAALMAEHVLEGDEMAEAMVPATDLGIVIGVYVLTLCLILTPLSLALRHGLDRAMIGYYAGRSLVFATPIYIATVTLIGVFIT